MMPQNICLRQLYNALLESQVPRSASAIRRAAFSTTSPCARKPVEAGKKTTPGGQKNGPPKRGTKALRIKKSVREKTGKPPEPGERKALRKRVVLSNTNALVVPGLGDLSAENMAQETSRGKVLGFPSASIDALRAIDAFKPRQGWSFFRRPAALMRKEAVDVAQLVQRVHSSQEPHTTRKIIVGERGSGKSTLLLQAMAMAFLKGWVVISLPEAQDLVNGNTDYAPLPNTQPTQYIQKSYTQQLLTQTAKANRVTLSKLQLTLEHQLPVPVQSNISLDRFCEMGASDPELAWPFFNALWRELTAVGTKEKRPPIMLTMDGIHHVMKESKYMSADFKPVHAHDLALVSWFASNLGGKSSLPNGGAVMVATSESNRPASEALDFAIKQNEHAQTPESVVKGDEPVWNPYERLDENIMNAMNGVEVLRLRGLSKDEARSVMEYWAHSGMMRQIVDDGVVGERWALAGGGIIGELEKCSVKWRV